MGHAKQSESWERLQLLVKHHDGFLIAEEDFRLRGPGNWNGAEQSGMKHWKFLTLPEDESLLERARIWTQSWAAQGD
jgi:ATP-dependent DNA helicase RecG